MNDKLADLEVLTLSGKKLKMSDIWREQPVVLTFLRHFGCMLCREHVGELMQAQRAIRDLGAELVFIGNGTPYFASAFQEDFAIDAPIYTDPSGAVYEAAEMNRGWRSSLSMGVLQNALRARRDGFRQGEIQGDIWQQGGIVIIDCDGRTRYRYASTVAGDHPPLERVLAELGRMSVTVAPGDAAAG